MNIFQQKYVGDVQETCACNYQEGFPRKPQYKNNLFYQQGQLITLTDYNTKQLTNRHKKHSSQTSNKKQYHKWFKYTLLIIQIAGAEKWVEIPSTTTFSKACR